MHFGSSPLASITEKALGTISRILRPKTKLFAVKFRRISKVLCLQGLQKKLWAQFHDMCVQNWSSLLWSSDAFWKFSPCKLYKKSSGRIFPIYASKNEAVYREVQMHFGSFRHSSFIKKLWAHFPDLCIQKWSGLPWSSDAFWNFSACESYRKSCGRNSTICAPKNEAVCREI